jgi:hypothetical protein
VTSAAAPAKRPKSRWVINWSLPRSIGRCGGNVRAKPPGFACLPWCWAEARSCCHGSGIRCAPTPGGVILAAYGVTVLGFGPVPELRTRRLLEHGVQVQGTVVGAEEKTAQGAPAARRPAPGRLRRRHHGPSTDRGFRDDAWRKRRSRSTTCSCWWRWGDSNSLELRSRCASLSRDDGRI